MRDHLNGIEALVTWSREALADHGASCVCPGCQARGRAEAALEAVRDVLATLGTGTPEEAGEIRQPTQASLL
jgi:hypothetical protein